MVTWCHISENSASAGSGPKHVHAPLLFFFFFGLLFVEKCLCPVTIPSLSFFFFFSFKGVEPSIANGSPWPS